MNVYMITADYRGSPDSAQIGVADTEMSAWTLVAAWLMKHVDAKDVPICPAQGQGCTDWYAGLHRIAHEHEWFVSVHEHTINVMDVVNT